MKSRFSVGILLVASMLLIVILAHSPTDVVAERQGTFVAEAEALQTLAHGRLVAVDPDTYQLDQPAAAAETDALFPAANIGDGPSELTGAITFASNRAGSFGVYVQDATSFSADLVIGGSGNNATPVWSPDGSQLVFASDRDGDFEIFLREADGTEVQLTDNSAEDIHPSWSPDGSRILFSSNRSGAFYQAYSMDPSGSNVTRIGNINYNVLYPRYSPDGSRIAYMQASIAIPACDWNWNIWVMDADGSHAADVTAQLGGDLYPSWTADGRIIYARCGNFVFSDLYIIDPDSGVKEQVTDWFLSSELHATYSPDKNHFAFNATADGNYEIYIGTWATNLAYNFSQNSAEDLPPDWSGQHAFDPCAGAVTGLQPIVLAPGWGAADTIGEDSGGFKAMLPTLQGHGYRLGCNLFWAGDTAPTVDIYENGRIIRDAVCDAYDAIKAFDPAWNRRLDIIGHSFGGMRSRAFLEEAPLYDLTGFNGVQCDPPYALPPGEKLFVDNLFTLGSPHGGGSPDLPGALLIGLFHISRDEWVSLQELLFGMLPFIYSHAQPEGVCYWFIAGNAWEQPLTHATLGWLYADYQKLVPNDLGVYRLSSYAPALLRPHQYDEVVLAGTHDMHGYSDLLFFIDSYVHPNDTFDDEIWPHLGKNMAHCAAAQTPVAGYALAEEMPRVPMQLIASDSISSNGTQSGSFQLTESGTTTIYLDWPTGSLTLTLTDPDGNVWTAATAAGDPDVEYAEMTIMSQVAAFKFPNTVTGTWSYEIESATLPYEMPYRLVALFDNPITTSSSVAEFQQVGATVVITGSVQAGDGSALTGATVEAVIARPDMTTATVSLFDDGAHNDGAANDGVYGNVYTDTTLAGRYSATVRANGIHDGQEYARSAESLFTIAAPTATLTGQYSDRAVDESGNGYYDWLDIDVGVDVNTAGLFSVSADLYTLTGDYVGHGLTRTNLPGGDSDVTLRFSGQVIANSGYDGPYVLTNVLLIDEANGLVPLDEAVDAHQTAAYAHTQFGSPPPVYLPMITKD